jgi:hypothetical protein
MNKSTLDFQKFRNKTIAASAVGASVIGVASPSFAQSATPPSPNDVAATLTTVGTVAGGAVAIVLGAMGIRLAVKMVNRLSVKG